jgi:hypothetical protein
MVLFLRNQDNETIADIEVYDTKESGDKNYYAELSASIIIDKYTKKFINLYVKDKMLAQEFAQDMNEVSNLRGWLWEDYKLHNKNCDYMEVVKELRPWLQELAEKYNLMYRED